MSQGTTLVVPIQTLQILPGRSWPPATGAEGYGLQPVHLSQPKLEGALAPEGPEKIVFHDPCYLGRYRNIYDEPRTIVAQSGQLVEDPRIHERSFCCGDRRQPRLPRRRIRPARQPKAAFRELRSRPAQPPCAAACPFCNTMLNDALAATTARYRSSTRRHRATRRAQPATINHACGSTKT